MSQTAHNGQDPTEILEIQITGGTLQNEALMRYVSNAASIEAIRKIFKAAFEGLVRLEADPQLKCPVGWRHRGCKCEPMTIAIAVDQETGR